MAGRQCEVLSRGLFLKPSVVIYSLAVALLLNFGACAIAEQFPLRPITIIVPFAAGGAADANARPLANVLEKLLKQPVIVLNKPGAGGAIGAAQVVKAKPDGYTLLMALSTISVVPEADRLFGRPAAYELDQFVPIALLSAEPTVLIVRTDSPWKSVNDVVADARSRPGQIAYGSSGSYGPIQLSIEMFAQAAGLQLHHIPYSGAAPALTALLSNQIGLTAISPATAIPQMQAGKIKVLANWGAKRIAALPEVPTFRELGFDIEYYVWAGLFAPAGTPAEVIRIYRDSVREAANSQDFVQGMARPGIPINYLDAPEFRKFWLDDARRLIEVVKRIGRVD